MIVAAGGIFHAVGQFKPPSDMRCFAPGGSFYIALNEDGTFRKVE